MLLPPVAEKHWTNMKNLSALPTIDARPDADIVIFDGECNFCTRQSRRLEGWDRSGRLAFLSLHDPRVPGMFPDLSHDQLMQQMYVVDRRGRRHGGASAVRYLTRRLPGLWWLAPLLHIPFTLPLWRWLYRRVAQRRYLLSGDKACDDGRCEIR
jgi:predicted DCC family thiol-disulfide oxidoreductase YuxK